MSKGCLPAVSTLAGVLALVALGCSKADQPGPTPAPVTQPATRPARVKVAAIQFMSEFGRPAENRKRLEPYVREAARHGAKIIVLPETCIPGYMTYDLQTTWQLPGRIISLGLKGVPPACAETVPGESTLEFGRLAAELKVYLTVPLIEVDPNTNRYFNTIVLMGPDGRQLLHYRKKNPWPYAERGWAAPGDLGNPCVDTPFGRLSLLVCFDIHFEPPRLKELKVDTLLYCIAWVDLPDSRWFYDGLPGIARDNRLNIIGANWTVPHRPDDWHGYGHTLILDRTGRALARANQDVGEEIVYAELAVPER